jgi:serine/threonine protein kinase
MVGKTFAHYVVLEKVGAGGMGMVFRARDETLRRDVALKLPPTDSVTDAESRELILREARAASALNHPHICTIYEVGEKRGLCRTCSSPVLIMHSMYRGMESGSSLQNSSTSRMRFGCWNLSIRIDEFGSKNQRATLRRRKALAMTETELKLIAALASIGLRSQPKIG